MDSVIHGGLLALGNRPDVLENFPVLARTLRNLGRVLGHIEHEINRNLTARAIPNDGGSVELRPQMWHECVRSGDWYIVDYDEFEHSCHSDLQTAVESR